MCVGTGRGASIREYLKKIKAYSVLFLMKVKLRYFSTPETYIIFYVNYISIYK